MTISNFAAYVKQLWKNKPDVTTPLSAARLLHMEDGIKGNSDAIEKIAAAVVSQIINDPNKIASMAALYSVNQKIGDTSKLPAGTADLVSAFTKVNSEIATRKNLINLFDISWRSYANIDEALKNEVKKGFFNTRANYIIGAVCNSGNPYLILASSTNVGLVFGIYFSYNASEIKIFSYTNDV